MCSAVLCLCFRLSPRLSLHLCLKASESESHSHLHLHKIRSLSSSKTSTPCSQYTLQSLSQPLSQSLSLPATDPAVCLGSSVLFTLLIRPPHASCCRSRMPSPTPCCHPCVHPPTLSMLPHSAQGCNLCGTRHEQHACVPSSTCLPPPPLRHSPPSSQFTSTNTAGVPRHASLILCFHCLAVCVF